MNTNVPEQSQDDKNNSGQGRNNKSKAELIRELIKDNPSSTNNEIIAIMTERGIQIKADYVRRIKSEAKTRKKKISKQTQRPKKATKAPTQSSPRSYPRATLEDTLKIATAIKNLNGGNPWQPDEIAKALELGARSSKFYYLTSSSREYGLTEGIARSSKPIQLAKIGTAIVYASSPTQESQAIQSAFFSIPTFKAVYEYYNDGELPELKYLSNTLETQFHIPREHHSEFIEIYNINRQYVLRRVSELGNTPINKASTIKPSGSTIKFDSPTTHSSILAFVAMPFSEKTDIYPSGFYNEVFNTLIIPAATEAGFRVETARKDGSDIIQSTIVKRLLDADLVIVDLSDHNPNVLFELGLRLAAEKPTALIRAKGTKPIFDVDNMLRVYDYNPNLWKSTVDVDLPGLTAHIGSSALNREH